MTIALRQIIVPRENRLVHQGQAVRLTAQLVDHAVFDRLSDAVETPMVSLFDPLSVKLWNDAEMLPVTTGHYERVYQTTNQSPLGVYTASFSAYDGTTYAHINRVSVFKVIKGSIFAELSYLGIKDQTGVVWYWWLLADATIQTSLTPPNIPIKDNVSLFDTIPWWVEIGSDNGPLRYAYPDVAGDIIVDDIPPPIGFGVTVAETLTWFAYNGLGYTLKIDTADQLYTQEV
jgi:hypothetical protein